MPSSDKAAVYGTGLQEEAEAWSKLVADTKAQMDARLVPIVGNISALEGRNRSTYDSFFAMPQILADRAAALLETARTDAASLQSAREAEDVAESGRLARPSAAAS